MDLKTKAFTEGCSESCVESSVRTNVLFTYELALYQHKTRWSVKSIGHSKATISKALVVLLATKVKIQKAGTSTSCTIIVVRMRTQSHV